MPIGTAVNRAALNATPSPPAIYAHPISHISICILSSIAAYLTAHQPQRIANILDLLSGAESARPNNIFYFLQPRRPARCLSSLSVCASLASYSFLAYSTS